MQEYYSDGPQNACYIQLNKNCHIFFLNYTAMPNNAAIVINPAV